MNNNYSIKLISQKDIIDSGCLNIPEIIKKCEEAFYDFSENKIIFPDKISVVFNEENQNRINCLPAALKEDKVYGMKWVSVFPDNPTLFNRPNLSAVILLSELKTGYPLALLEGGLCTNLRTACVGAIAAKYLAKKDSKNIGFIGAGEQAKSHLVAMKSVFQNISICKISSRTTESVDNFIKQMKKIFPDIQFVNCNNNYRKAVENTDIIVTAISGQEKILKSEWIADGSFYCHVAGLEDEFDVALKADKIVCDDWNVVKHRTQTISQMYKLGILNDDDIYCNLADLLSNKKCGRENDNEFIYFNSVGLSFLDVKIAYWMYEKVIEQKKGSNFILKSENIFESYGKSIII